MALRIWLPSSVHLGVVPNSQGSIDDLSYARLQDIWPKQSDEPSRIVLRSRIAVDSEIQIALTSSHQKSSPEFLGLV